MNHSSSGSLALRKAQNPGHAAHRFRGMSHTFRKEMGRERNAG